MPIGTITDTVSNAINSAKDAVNDVVNEGADAIVDTASDAGGGLFDGDFFSLDTVKDLGKGVFEGAKDVLTGQETLGGGVGTALDSLGLPDWASDFAAAGVDFVTKNYSGAAEHGLSGLGEVADAAGADGVSDFLHTASDVTGMFNDVTGGMGPGAVASGGIGNVGGALGSLGDAGGMLGEVGGLLDGADGLAGQLDTALDVADLFDGGDLAGAGGGIMDMLGDSFGGFGGILDGVLGPPGGGLVDGLVGGPLGGILDQAGPLLDSIFDQFGNSDNVSEMPTPEILDGVGGTVLDCGGLAPQFVDLAAECIDYNQGNSSHDSLGQVIIDSDAAQQLIDGLADILREEGVTIQAEDVTMEDVVADCVSTTGGMLSMAEASVEVTLDVTVTLEQAGSISTGGAVSEMHGAQVRC